MATIPAEFLDQVDDATRDIAAALRGHQHRAALAALLRVFSEVAQASPCCLHAAATDAVAIGTQLLSHNAGHSGALH